MIVKTVITLEIEVDANDNYGPEWTLKDIKRDSKNKTITAVSQLRDKVPGIRIKGDPKVKYYIAEEED